MRTAAAFSEIEAGADLAALLARLLAACLTDDECESVVCEITDKALRRGVIGLDTAAALSSVFLSD